MARIGFRALLWLPVGQATIRFLRAWIAWWRLPRCGRGKTAVDRPGRPEFAQCGEKGPNAMSGGVTMRTEMMAMFGLLMFAPVAFAGDLVIAARNLERLDDSDRAGCVGRGTDDYATPAQRISELEADVVAFREVENTAAAWRVFPQSGCRVELSRRPQMAQGRICWNRPGALLNHLAKGFAIQRGVAYERNADPEAPGGGETFQHWGAPTSPS